MARLTQEEVRKSAARDISEREGISYKSAMRRLQRYVTEAGQKRKPKNLETVPEPLREEVKRRRFKEPRGPYKPPPKGITLIAHFVTDTYEEGTPLRKYTLPHFENRRDAIEVARDYAANKGNLQWLSESARMVDVWYIPEGKGTYTKRLPTKGDKRRRYLQPAGAGGDYLVVIWVISHTVEERVKLAYTGARTYIVEEDEDEEDEDEEDEDT